jgi:hypothetical protein
MNNALLNNQWIIKEIRRGIKSLWNLMEIKTQFMKALGIEQRQC